jgi:hypothetical protein
MLRFPTVARLSPTPDSKTEERFVLLFETSEHNIYRADVVIQSGTYSDDPVLWAKAMAAGWAKVLDDAEMKHVAVNGADFDADIIVKPYIDDYDPEVPHTFEERCRVVVSHVYKEIS